MNRIQEAVAACLQERTGVRTVCGRSHLREYPMLAVEAAENGTVLLDGGRQAEHSYTVTVTAASDRTRAHNGDLLASLTPLLLGGIPMTCGDGKRALHPLNCETDGETLTFSLALCVPVPPLPDSRPAATDTMETLHLGL